MQKKRLQTLVVPCLLALAAVDAGALGFAPVEPSTPLGQPLDHVIGVQLEAEEALNPECVAAEVLVGETRLAPAMVRARLERSGGTPVLRVRTLMPVDEPLVAVTLSLGCPVRLQRRFVIFADPVGGAAPIAPLVLAPAEDVASASQARAAAPPPMPDRPRVQAVREPAARLSSGSGDAARASAATPRRAARAAEPAAARPAKRDRPRLRLDAEPPMAPGPGDAAREAAIEAAVAAQAQAQALEEAGARAAAQAASAAAARIAALEQAIERLSADAAADRQALLHLRQSAAAADARAQWAPWLLAFAGLLAALCAWLMMKLRRLQRQHGQAWAHIAERAQAEEPATAVRAGAGATDAIAGALASTAGGDSSTRPGLLAPTHGPAGADDSAHGGLSVTERTEVLPVGWRGEDDEPRDVSIEELIDLEQQAEFFAVLGQEEAAIDLLVDHLRKTGGGSPMPYLKLLEIYRRLENREAYERTRARFNHRFNAYAPQWDADPGAGRALEEYGAIIARLQQVWTVPLDAMAELEALLFRKARGELFDLPAYRDVILLYSLARDLLDREALESGKVDVLLPLSEGGDHTQPLSLDDLPLAGDSALAALDQPTVPVDLDVTQPMTPASLFGESEDAPDGNGRRQRSS